MSLAVAHPPRITKEKFRTLLEAAHSPAAAEAEACYEAIASQGIDPAIGLAFFQHESGFGSAGVARKTRNWGNLRHGQGRATKEADGWAWYPRWADSAADWASLIKTRYVNRGLTTVADILPVYAPASDHNVPQMYIHAVETAVQRWAMGEPRTVQYRVRADATDGAIIRAAPSRQANRRGVMLPLSGSRFSGQLVSGEPVSVPGFGQSDQWLHLGSGGYIWSGLVEEVQG